jgi:hypothetical protein
MKKHTKYSSIVPLELKKLQLNCTQVLLIMCSIMSFGQGTPNTGDSGENDRIKGKFEFVTLPFIDYNRAVGFTLGNRSILNKITKL